MATELIGEPLPQPAIQLETRGRRIRVNGQHASAKTADRRAIAQLGRDELKPEIDHLSQLRPGLLGVTRLFRHERSNGQITLRRHSVLSQLLKLAGDVPHNNNFTTALFRCARIFRLRGPDRPVIGRTPSPWSNPVGRAGAPYNRHGARRRQRARLSVCIDAPLRMHPGSVGPCRCAAACYPTSNPRRCSTPSN